MDAITILRAQLKRSHDLLEFAMNDLSIEHLHHTGEGSTIQSIATIYVHVVHSEDILLNGVVRHQPTLFEREGWEEKVGFGRKESMAEIAEAVAGSDLNAFRSYAQAVYAESDAFLASLGESGDDLERTISFGALGDMPLGIYLGTVVAWHFDHHTGEICALKGYLGGQGLPF